MAREVILQPGELFFGKEDVVVRTVLGSCIAITLWHPEQKQGGMCHYMLPSRRNPSAKLDGRYADEALALLLQAASHYPAPIHEYEAKLFGGATCLPSLNTHRATTMSPPKIFRQPGS